MKSLLVGKKFRFPYSYLIINKYSRIKFNVITVLFSLLCIWKFFVVIKFDDGGVSVVILWWLLPKKKMWNFWKMEHICDSVDFLHKTGSILINTYLLVCMWFTKRTNTCWTHIWFDYWWRNFWLKGTEEV